MEHDDKPLPIDIRTLGSLAEKCHAYAKALHYKEVPNEQPLSLLQTFFFSPRLNLKIRLPIRLKR